MISVIYGNAQLQNYFKVLKITIFQIFIEIKKFGLIKAEKKTYLRPIFNKYFTIE